MATFPSVAAYVENRAVRTHLLQSLAPCFDLRMAETMPEFAHHISDFEGVAVVEFSDVERNAAWVKARKACDRADIPLILVTDQPGVETHQGLPAADEYLSLRPTTRECYVRICAQYDLMALVLASRGGSSQESLRLALCRKLREPLNVVSVAADLLISSTESGETQVATRNAMQRSIGKINEVLLGSER